MDLEAAVDAIREALPGVSAVYLFGSEAEGETHAESDVDLAVLADAPLGPLERFDLQERLASLLHRTVDLIDLRRASTVLRVQVIDGAVVLFDRDPHAREAFEAAALGAYARLNEERRAILDDVRRRGRVHG